MNAKYDKLAIRNFLFLDVEFVREYPTWLQMTNHKNPEIWERMAKRHVEDDKITARDAYEKYAGLYPEYGKVVAVGLGGFDENYNKKVAKISGDNEEALLKSLAGYLDSVYTKNQATVIAGHNIIEYDIPLLIKRMMKYKIRIPKMFYNFLYDKVWDAKIADTIKDYRMGGNRMMSLDAICEYFGIPSPKDAEVNGSNIGDFYWTHKQANSDPFPLIDKYVMGDVSATMDLVLIMSDTIF